MHPSKPDTPVINYSYIEDDNVTGTGIANFKIDVTYFNSSGIELLNRTVTVDSEGKWKDPIPDGITEDASVTAVQYINPSVKSDEVKWIFPPEIPTINAMSAGEGQHITGTGKPNYFIHYHVQNPDGAGETTSQKIEEDGNWRTINAISRLDSGATITARQSKGEFDDFEKQSKEAKITVS